MTPEVGKFYKVHWGDTYIGALDWCYKIQSNTYSLQFLREVFENRKGLLLELGYRDSIFECVGYIPSRQVEGIQEQIYALKCRDYITFADRVEIEYKLKGIWK